MGFWVDCRCAFLIQTSGDVFVQNFKNLEIDEISWEFENVISFVRKHYPPFAQKTSFNFQHKNYFQTSHYIKRSFIWPSGFNV